MFLMTSSEHIISKCLKMFNYEQIDYAYFEITSKKISQVLCLCLPARTLSLQQQQPAIDSPAQGYRRPSEHAKWGRLRAHDALLCPHPVSRACCPDLWRVRSHQQWDWKRYWVWGRVGEGRNAECNNSSKGCMWAVFRGGQVSTRNWFFFPLKKSLCQGLYTFGSWNPLFVPTLYHVYT